ncbi:carboxymuconolactone decarboxylase family protein [Cystobacter fuscus]|uniref:carboxymuconolactone decarboxylase family protein n=1 Tax=Cystobacter fuscus TaxID=43 RepID=UPI002B2A950D|nr:peroxidase-related enzyme [Cystobacter fuscus]
MSRISSPTADSAPSSTQPLLQSLQKKLGRVPNLYATIGHSPGALQSMLSWEEALSRGNTLSRREREQLSLHVSELNGCGYCISAHSAIGKSAGLSEQDIDAARVGAGVNARENAILALARRVVRTGGHGAGGELTRAREAGLTDAEVVDIIAAVSLRSFTNAVAVIAQTELDWPKAPSLPEA